MMYFCSNCTTSNASIIVSYQCRSAQISPLLTLIESGMFRISFLVVFLIVVLLILLYLLLPILFHNRNTIFAIARAVRNYTPTSSTHFHNKGPITTFLLFRHFLTSFLKFVNYPSPKGNGLLRC